jgi:cytoskeletal protein CcmA (bactofilin family)
MGLLGKKETNDKPCNTIDTLIGVKAEIKGDVNFSGGLRIDGKIKGNITARGDTSSTLVLSEQAVITGNITVPHMVINGTVKGSVRASERIVLQAKADITGDVTYKTIEMALGATVNGSLVREHEKSAVAKLKPVPTASASSGGSVGELE